MINPDEREKLFASLAKKGMPPFAASVLGFTLGSLMDYGADQDEVMALCKILLDQISAAKQNPEAVASIKNFSEVIEKSMSAT